NRPLQDLLPEHPLPGHHYHVGTSSLPTRFITPFMTSALSPEQVELNSLLTQHIALSNAMNVGETKQSSLLWPSKLLDSAKSKTNLSTLPTRARLITINGSKLHTYQKKEAPYPLSYSQSVLDRKLCSNGLTLHDFGDSPPSSVLDIGTGSGNWILEAASTWKDTKKLVGFDLVEIQPIISHDGPLGDLPFADASFDFVRICRIALGIPENKWNHVLEEVSRVLRSGGIAEVIEEDILFPFAPSQEYNYVADVNCSSPSPSVSVHGDPESSVSLSPNRLTRGHEVVHLGPIIAKSHKQLSILP
ncbi:9386_t:CDS:2, partial [Acaulospora colombiana]